jgi:hypothetical protein
MYQKNTIYLNFKCQKKKNLKLHVMNKSTNLFLFKLTLNLYKSNVNSKMHSLNILKFYFNTLNISNFNRIASFIFPKMIRYYLFTYLGSVVKMVIIDTKITAFSYRQVVTEKGGVHRTHNTPTVANEPCRLDSADLLHFTQNSNPSHIVTTDRPFPLHLTDRRMYRHNNVTDLKYPSSALPFIQV